MGPKYFTEDNCKSLAGPSAKKPKSLSLKKPGKENSNPAMHFEEAFTAASDDQYDLLAKGIVNLPTRTLVSMDARSLCIWKLFSRV